MKVKLQHNMAEAAEKQEFEVEIAGLTAADAGKILVVGSNGKATLLALPADAATKTYTLKAVNGVLTWSV